jgi:hypothetical protein
MTYELRRRGYDVEARARTSAHNLEFYSEVYEKKDGSFLNANTWTGHDVRRGLRTVTVYDVKNSENVFSAACSDDAAEKLATGVGSYKRVRKASEYYDAVNKNVPNGSRGAVNVFWDGGGGHSFVWEKNKLGEVHFYDAQTNVEYTKSDIQHICDSTDQRMPAVFVRTDDLAIREESTNYFQERVVDSPEGGTAKDWTDSKRTTGKDRYANY